MNTLLPHAQPPALDSGLACLVMLARFHGIAADAAPLAHEFKGDGKPFGVSEILLAAKKLELKAKRVKSEIARLKTTPLPAMAVDIDGQFFILARAEEDQVLIHDPRVERPQLISRDEFIALVW